MSDDSKRYRHLISNYDVRTLVGVGDLTAEAAPAGEVASEPDKLWCETCEGGGMIIHQVRGECSCPDCDGKGYWTRATPATEPAAPGYVSVPVEPTVEMIDAAILCSNEWDRGTTDFAGLYRAMLAAASRVQGKEKP